MPLHHVTFMDNIDEAADIFFAVLLDDVKIPRMYICVLHCKVPFPNNGQRACWIAAFTVCIIRFKYQGPLEK